jgi:hypothetical protein
MELAFAAFLAIVTIVSAAALAIGVPLAFGVMAYDVVQSRKARTYEVGDAHAHIAIERGVARTFVILGAAFWSIATFAQLYSGGQAGTGEAVLAAFVPLGASLVTLVLGWYWERLTAAALMLGALGVVAWGVVYGFGLQTWVIMTVMLIGPMVTASVLFWLARREQEAYERATALSPQLAFAFAARSNLHS